jgi:hypothetical protein
MVLMRQFGMGLRDLLFFGVVLGGAGTFAAGLLTPVDRPKRTSQVVRPVAGASASPVPNIRPIVDQVNEAFRASWKKRALKCAPAASELTVIRRLSLALAGSIPSLEEIRRNESRPEGERIDAWLDDMLRDRRSADYLAERFARAFVGTEDGPFILFRRRRFAAWLSDALLENRPYDAVVRDLIADTGLWTDHPATNFVSVTFNPEAGRPDPERLAARVSRAFLGIRLDCAQCHDHPFQAWKQADFRGLAAYFGRVHSNLRGIRDREGESDYRPSDRKTKEPTPVRPQVPFQPELLPGSGTPRQQLACWVVNPKNPSFARAMVNRVWALLFSRPLVEPVDDLTVSGEMPVALNLLANDFASHGYDIHRLLRVIAALEVFRLDSALPESTDVGPTAEYEASWAVFPLTRLRPEQVAGALYQAASLSTLDGQNPWIYRLAVYTGRNDFVRRYGDTGEDEFETRGGTIPQRLLMMNGSLVRDKIKDDFLNAASRIAMLAPDDSKAVEAAYLSVLTRRPSPEELSHFSAKLAGSKGQGRKDQVGDLFWTLLNSTEFSWNH